jgi:hypothetical protein
MLEPGDVARQQVRRALDAGRPQVEGRGDRPGEQRLAGAGDVLDEDVAVGQQRDEDQAERLRRSRRRPCRPRAGGRPRGASGVAALGRGRLGGAWARSRSGSARPRPASRRRPRPPRSALGREAPEDRRQDSALFVVADVDRAVEAGDRLEPLLRPALVGRDDASRCLGDSPASIPPIANDSRPVSPSEAALSPGRNWSGSTPIPTRFERWIRS